MSEQSAREAGLAAAARHAADGDPVGMADLARTAVTEQEQGRREALLEEVKARGE